MNLRGGWELIKKSYLGWMASRGFFWTLTFGWMVPSLLYLFVWVALAVQGQVQCFTRNNFFDYYLCLFMLNQSYFPFYTCIYVVSIYMLSLHTLHRHLCTVM